MQILLINLKRRSDRLAVMQERLCGMQFERIDAVDGRQWQPANPPKRTLYPLSTSELACIESHKAACQWVIDQKLPYACVLEDDVILSPDFKDYILDPSWTPEDARLIKIETLKQRAWLSTESWPARDRKLHQLHSYHAGGAGYIISQEGAKALIELLATSDQACDDILFKRTLEEPAFNRVLQMDPALCIQEFVLSDDSSESDILAERTDLRTRLINHPSRTAKIWREIKRPFVRTFEKIRRWDQTYRKVTFR